MPRVSLNVFAGVLMMLTFEMANSEARRSFQKVAFEESVSRFPAPLVVIELLRSLAPFQSATGLSNSCLRIDEASAAVLGAIDPGQLQPLEQTPGALFFNYFENCAKTMIKLGFENEDLASQNSVAILETSLARKLLAATGQNEVSRAWAQPFGNLPAGLQIELVDQIVFFVIGGEEVLFHHRYIGDKNVFGRHLESAGDLRQFILENLAKGSRPGQDSVLGFYTRLSVLLHLGPVLKN